MKLKKLGQSTGAEATRATFIVNCLSMQSTVSVADSPLSTFSAFILLWPFWRIAITLRSGADKRFAVALPLLRGKLPLYLRVHFFLQFTWRLCVNLPSKNCVPCEPLNINLYYSKMQRQFPEAATLPQTACLHRALDSIAVRRWSFKWIDRREFHAKFCSLIFFLLDEDVKSCTLRKILVSIRSLIFYSNAEFITL